MNPLAEEYHQQLAAHLDNQQPAKFMVPMFSLVTGRYFEDVNSLRLSAHWVQIMMQPVLSQDSFTDMMASDGSRKDSTALPRIDVLIEVGPYGALKGAVRQNLTQPRLTSVMAGIKNCLTRLQNAVTTLQGMEGRLYCQVYPLNFEAVNFPNGRGTLKVIHNFSEYSWNHSVGYRPSRAGDALRRKHGRHDLLGVWVEGLKPDVAIWRNTVHAADVPWLRHHLESEVLFPGAGLTLTVAEAMRQLAPTDEKVVGYALSDVDLYNELVVPDTDLVFELQVVIREQSQKLLRRSPQGIYFLFSRKGWPMVRALPR